MKKVHSTIRNIRHRGMFALLMLLIFMLSACGKSAEDGQTGTAEESSEEADASQTAEDSAEAAYEALKAEIEGITPQKPEMLGTIELGEYKGINVTAQAADEITDADALLYIEQNILPMYLEDTDEPAAEGMTVNIDYVGTVDGEEFEGGSADGQVFVLGAGGYIDGFEDGIVGMKAGETKDINVTFPEGYGTEDISGKPAVFTIKMNSVQKQREFNDELAGELDPDCSTKDEYIASIRSFLQEQEDINAALMLYDSAVKAVMEGCATVEPSEEAIEWRMQETIISDDQMMSSSYGLGLADYLSIYGITLDEYKDSVRAMCEEQAKQYLVTEAICEAEGLEATEQELENWAQANGVDMEMVNAVYDAEESAIRCRAWLAAELIADNAVVEYVSAETASASDAQAEAQ